MTSSEIKLPDLSEIDMSQMKPLLGQTSSGGERKLGWGSELVNRVGISWFAGLTSAGALGMIEGHRQALPHAGYKIKLNQMLNRAGKRGSITANMCAVLASFFVTIKHYGPQTWLGLDITEGQNTVLSGVLSGILYKSASNSPITMLKYGMIGGLLPIFYYSTLWISE